MSTWPTMSDYQEAVQNPKNCFSDAELQRGTATLNALGLPQPVTGGFCSVYQLTAGRTRWAVRCFLHNIKDIQDRYSQISKHLKSKMDEVGVECVFHMDSDYPGGMRELTNDMYEWMKKHFDAK